MTQVLKRINNISTCLAFIPMMKLIFTTLLVGLLPYLSIGQTLTAITARWDDNFAEWNIYTDDDEDEAQGQLELRWGRDWKEWDYRIGDYTGSMEQRWREDPTQWEIRGDNEIVTARTIWFDNLTEWRLTDNDITLTLKPRWGTFANEWVIEEEQYGTFEIYTEYEFDPRDWVIVDELSEEISLNMKMAIVFLVVYHSIRQ